MKTVDFRALAGWNPNGCIPITHTPGDMLLAVPAQIAMASKHSQAEKPKTRAVWSSEPVSTDQPSLLMARS